MPADAIDHFYTGIYGPQHIPNTMTNNTLERLSAREQLMWDIIAIISDSSDSGHICKESTDMLQTLLCDAVCRNFPKQTNP